MPSYRVTKYDPQFRTASGCYTRDEWTSVSDIGKRYNGVTLSRAEYERVEAAYIDTALAFLNEAGVASLQIQDLEDHHQVASCYANGESLTSKELKAVLRSLLREEFWCRLEGHEAFVHIGYDFCMYIGVPCACPGAEALADQLGLFVELFRSPYIIDHDGLRRGLTTVQSQRVKDLICFISSINPFVVCEPHALACCFSSFFVNPHRAHFVSFHKTRVLAQFKI